MRRHLDRKVERGIPIPPPPKPRKKRHARTYAPSPWIEFLKNLRDGDSFPVWFSEHTTVKKYLHQLNITYEYRWLGAGAGGRFWILDQPHQPEYKNAGLDI